MTEKKDILVLKANLNSDCEVDDLVEYFNNAFPDDEILILKVDDPKDACAYWASADDILYADSELELKQGLDLYATSVDYDKDSDTYIYHTGVNITKADNSNATLMINPGESDAFLSENILPINGEIILKYKNRTTWPVIVMFNNFDFILKTTEGLTIDNNKSTGETIQEIKKNAVTSPKIPNPMDYAPFEIGELIGTAYLVKLPIIKNKARLDIKEIETICG